MNDADEQPDRGPVIPRASSARSSTCATTTDGSAKSSSCSWPCDVLDAAKRLAARAGIAGQAAWDAALLKHQVQPARTARSAERGRRWLAFRAWGGEWQRTGASTRQMDGYRERQRTQALNNIESFESRDNPLWRK
jgi:hypothetical protein